MASLVKTKKIGLISFTSLIILLLVYVKISLPISENDRYKYWTPDSTLYLDDFKKIGKIVSPGPFSATISTKILIEELGDGKYKAKTTIDRYKSSFLKRHYSDYLLNHEKYHANIVAVTTKEFNEILNEITFKNKRQLDEQHQRFINRYKRLHYYYDKETNHSINKPFQYYWEYKIDSLYYRHDKLNNHDIYSGISCYFPCPPKIEIHIDTFHMRKLFFLEKYNMSFRFYTDYDISIDTSAFFNGFKNHLKGVNFINALISDTIVDDRYIIISESDDTASNRKFYDKIIYDYPYLYQLTVNYPLITDNDTLYKLMKNQFLKSLQISKNDEYWISIFEEGAKNIAKSDLAP